LSCRENPPWLGALACWIPQPQAADHEEATLRYVYIELIVSLTALLVLFKFQNLEAVTVSLFSASMTLSVSTLVMFSKCWKW
jgi:uncharacterized integral membrane protein